MITLTVGYPVIWGAITLVRGAVVGWYPYFFLDPDQVTDPFEFVTYSAIALATFAVTSTGVISLARLRPVAEMLSPRTVPESAEQT